jgi:3'-phosphoadenosine 5'-phosphosulfate sulfotransferase (PAPS reductase)/FAD synthetase
MLEQWQIKQRLAMPHDLKVEWARRRIREWYDYWHGMVYVAFSGGADSTALLHLVRDMYPDVPAVFCAEPTYPEVRAIVDTTPNATILKPKKNMTEIVGRYGLPIISKEVSRYVHEARRAGCGSATYRLRTTGDTSKGTHSKRSKLPACWMPLLTATFLVSDHCCKINKKQPSTAYQKATGRMPFVGTLASESNQRMLAYKRVGCNGFDLKSPRSTPLAVWTSEDTWKYIRGNCLRYAEVYDMGYTRTGCATCGFGCHLRHPNQFELLHETHPKIWRYAMDTLGFRAAIEWIRTHIKTKPARMLKCGDEPKQKMLPVV